MDEKNVTPESPVDDLEVEPLADDALESVAGGLSRDADGSSSGCCSCAACS